MKTKWFVVMMVVGNVSAIILGFYLSKMLIGGRLYKPRLEVGQVWAQQYDWEGSRYCFTNTITWVSRRIIFDDYVYYFRNGKTNSCLSAQFYMDSILLENSATNWLVVTNYVTEVVFTNWAVAPTYKTVDVLW